MDNRDMSVAPDRHPLARIARTVGTVRAVVAGVLAVPAVAALVGAELPGLVDGLLAALLVLLAAIGPLWSAFAVKTQGEDVVTPVADPRDNAGRQLVPATAGPDGTYGITTAR